MKKKLPHVKEASFVSLLSLQGSNADDPYFGVDVGLQTFCAAESSGHVSRVNETPILSIELRDLNRRSPARNGGIFFFEWRISKGFGSKKGLSDEGRPGFLYLTLPTGAMPEGFGKVRVIVPRAP